jgi:hypothetical protein
MTKIRTGTVQKYRTYILYKFKNSDANNNAAHFVNAFGSAVSYLKHLMVTFFVLPYGNLLFFGNFVGYISREFLNFALSVIQDYL